MEEVGKILQSLFYKVAVLKLMLLFAPVDLRGRHEDSCRSTEQVRPHRRLRRGGSPQRLRKAKWLERKSTDKVNTAYKVKIVH